MHEVTLCLNMAKVNSKEVRKKMAEAGIVPKHLVLKWLHLRINKKTEDVRWSTSAQNSYQCYGIYITVEPEQFIDVFSLLYLNPHLEAFQYIEILKLNKKQVINLSIDKSWNAWATYNYPKYFE